ncbi:MAG: ZIP family zinc transporter [Actinomycetota bacterium]
MLTAAVFGLIGGAALFLGAFVGIYTKISKHLVGAIMAFGSGVLISVLTTDLMQKAYESGGFDSVSIGFILGALLFVGGDYLIDRFGGHVRKRGHSNRYLAKHANQSAGSDAALASSGSAIFLGAMLDGIPESAAIGVGLAAGQGFGLVMLVAVFLSNFPEGISGALGMKQAGKTPGYIMAVWSSVVLTAGISSVLGYQFLAKAAPDIMAASLAIAAGAILAMLADTMMPEAFEEGGRLVALVTVLGFLAAFIVSRLAG